MTVDVKLDGDKVVDYGADVKACALGQASSSIMARHVIGASVKELHEVAAAMRETVRFLAQLGHISLNHAETAADLAALGRPSATVAGIWVAFFQECQQ